MKKAQLAAILTAFVASIGPSLCLGGTTTAPAGPDEATAFRPSGQRRE